MPQGVEPRDGLLPQVAPLHERDRPRVAVHLLGEIFLVDVAAERGRPGLDPQGFVRFAVQRSEARPAEGFEQRGGVGFRSDEREAGDAGGGLAEEQDADAGRRRLDRRQVVRSGERRADAFQPGRRAGAEDVELRRLTRDLIEPDVVEDPVLLEVRQREAEPAGVGAEEDGVEEGVGDDEGQGLPLRAGDERLAAAADGQPLDVVGGEVVQELRPIRSGHAQAGAIAAIDPRRPFAGRSILFGGRHDRVAG